MEKRVAEAGTEAQPAVTLGASGENPPVLSHQWIECSDMIDTSATDGGVANFAHPGITLNSNGQPQIRFTNADANYCEHVANLRYTYNLQRPNGYGLRHDGRDENSMGAYGEYLVSLWLNIAWRPLVDNPWTELEGDVGPLQVRTALMRNNGLPSLITHDKDADDAVFVLVIRSAKDPMRFRVEGWTHGRESKQPQHWRANIPRPAFFMPSAALRHPSELHESYGR